MVPFYIDLPTNIQSIKNCIADQIIFQLLNGKVRMRISLKRVSQQAFRKIKKVWPSSKHHLSIDVNANQLRNEIKKTGGHSP